jgi:SAM-dependent methyltransferase
VPATPRSARQRSIRLFDRVAPVYDRVGPAFFQAFAHLLVERAAIPPGHRVLDVGTGRGALLRAVADDATARSVGVDLSAGMLAWGALDLRAAGARASLARMDGARLAFGDETFDVVVCGFTLDLVSDPEGLLAEARRVLRPGGRLAVSTWAADCPYFDWLAEALDGGPSGRRVRREVPPAASAEGLRRLLGRAGLTAVDIGTVDRRFVYTDADLWWRSLWSHCPRAVLERLGGPALRRLLPAMRERARDLSGPDGIRAELRAHLGVARRPVGAASTPAR